MECILNQVDPQFDPFQGFNYRLSVLLGQDGFSFLVTHAISQKVLKLSSYKLNLNKSETDETGGWPVNGHDYFESLKKVDCALMSWQRVDVAIASQKITVAPHDFFEHGGDMDIISAAHSVAAGEKILTEPVSDAGLVIASLVPGYIPEFCAALFPGSVLRNASAIFVKGVLRKHSLIIARHVFINIHQVFFEITVIHGLKLLYLNTFRYTAPSDVLYYVIFVLEQLGFVPSEEKITLMGDISTNSTIYLELKMYCGSLNFISKPVELQYGEAFSEPDMYNYFTLLNIPLCE